MIPSEQRDKIVDRIMAKFTAPEANPLLEYNPEDKSIKIVPDAKQGLSVEEIKQIIWSHGYGYETSPKLEKCAQEIHDAQKGTKCS